MPDVKVTIGGRNFSVFCNPGEEEDVSQSAKLLNNESDSLQEHIGRIPEDKILLLAGLLLGDKFRSLNNEKASLEGKLLEMTAKLKNLESDFKLEPNLEPDYSAQVESLTKFSKMLDSLIEGAEVKKGQSQAISNSTSLEDEDQKSLI